MTKGDRERLGRYVRACADLLELRDWTIYVDIDEPEEGPAGKRNATVEAVDGRKHACVTLAPSVRDTSPDDLRQTVAHELVHLHLWPLWQQLRLDLRDHLGQATYDVFMASAVRNLEYGVDALADAVSPRLPLIAWP